MLIVVFVKVTFLSKNTILSIPSKFILEEIKYTFNFGVADSEGYYSEFFTSKFRNLPESGLYTRGDNILLTADIPAGYNKIGWIMECGGISYDIEFSNFTFYPTTNDVFENSSCKFNI